MSSIPSQTSVSALTPTTPVIINIAVGGDAQGRGRQSVAEQVFLADLGVNLTALTAPQPQFNEEAAACIRTNTSYTHAQVIAKLTELTNQHQAQVAAWKAASGMSPTEMISVAVVDFLCNKYGFSRTDTGPSVKVLTEKSIQVQVMTTSFGSQITVTGAASWG